MGGGRTLGDLFPRLTTQIPHTVVRGRKEKQTEDKFHIQIHKNKCLVRIFVPRVHPSHWGAQRLPSPYSGRASTVRWRGGPPTRACSRTGVEDFVLLPALKKGRQPGAVNGAGAAWNIGKPILLRPHHRRNCRGLRGPWCAAGIDSSGAHLSLWGRGLTSPARRGSTVHTQRSYYWRILRSPFATRSVPLGSRISPPLNRILWHGALAQPGHPGLISMPGPPG